MPAVNEIREAARSADGAVHGYLRIALLPKTSAAFPAPLIHVLNDAEEDDTRAPIQLLEGQEYLYEWENLPAFVTTVSTDPEEAFQPDTLDGRKGRLRPGLSTGALQIMLRSGEVALGQLELEVRSRKLNYLSEYRWMLRDIADQMTELVMDRFAVSSTSFTHDGTRDAVTLYQRFAFLRALITSESFQIALHEITRRPHVAWEDRHEAVGPGQPLRASAHTLRQLARPGMRAPWPEGPIDSIPMRLDRRRTEATHDTTPNRFVRFALERWRQVVADIERGLARVADNPAVARGRREVAQTLEQLDTVLHHDLFKDLGPLTRFPADDQVLQRREGYRDVFRAYLEFELAAQLSWRGSDSSYEAGQRDVATLYEYWVFLQLAELVAKLAGQTFDLRPLIETRSDGLNVVLQSGKETVLSGFVERLGRKMAVELCFNRTFGQGEESLGSWTRPMRPDYSLIISAPVDEPAAFEPIVLHFDAKYRVNLIGELFGQGDDIVNTDEPASSGPELRREGALRADLLKMHAYRDAIRRSAGAYVLYPGDDDPSDRGRYKEYQELLPGLGAFVLRPSQDGDASGISTLRTFLDQVFDHVATRLTRHERGRYWLEEVYKQYELGESRPSPMTGSRPGPDATVLLGYVKNTAHWNWIQRTKNYNVRTRGRAGGVAANAELLYSQLLLLYCPDIGTIALARIVSGPELVRNAAMKSTGYPDPASDYLCVQLSWVSDQVLVAHLSADRIDQLVQHLGKLKGEPVSVNWAELERLRAT
jgi:uncharacterized protein